MCGPDLMPSFLDLAIGSRVRLTRNLCVAAGLVNGAQGTVESFVFKTKVPDILLPNDTALHIDVDDREIPIVLVRFDDVLKKGVGGNGDVFPIAPIACESGLRISGKMFKRYCLPLVLGHARTAHSVQAKYGVVTKLVTRFLITIM